MKTTKKVFLGVMLIAVMAFGFVLASCKQVYEGDAAGTDGSSLTSGKVTLTLKSKSYKIEYDGKTYNGDATKEKSGKTKVYVWTSGGSGGAIVDGKNVLLFTYTDGSVTIAAATLSKRSVEDGTISLDDIELIIEDDEE